MAACAQLRADYPGHDVDWVVIGSGFGGSVAALRLAERAIGMVEPRPS